jgi:GTPase Era involved in 16S rRNA processing
MKATAQFDTKQTLHLEALNAQLDRAGAVVESAVGAKSPLPMRLRALRERLRHGRLQIAVLGQFKRGKSTFVNALLGASLLPTDVVPLTAIPTFISWQEEPLVAVHFTDGRSSELFSASDIGAIRDSLFRFATEEGNPNNRRQVGRVDLFYPAAILANGTVLIDTPGIGSTLAHNTEAAVRVIPECDASLVIVSADPPITESELAYLRQIKPKIGRTFFVLNKIDYLTSDERRKVADFLRRVLTDQSLMEPETPIFCVSARLGLSAKQDGNSEDLKQSGLVQFEGYLESYLATEKMQSLSEAVRRKAADFLSQARGEVELRTRALKMPLEALERKTSEFARTLRSIEVQRRTISDLLAGDRRRLVDDLERRIGNLRRDALSALTQVVDDNLSQAAHDSEEAVKLAVALAMEELFSSAGKAFVAVFSKEAHGVLSDHKQQVDALVDEIHEAATRAFDVALAPESDPENFRLGEEPYWVTERVASTLIPNYGRVLDRMLPAAFRWRRRRASLIDQTNELIIRNAENLRWAVLRGLDETFRKAVTHFEERLGDAINATQGIIEEALVRRRDESFTSEAPLERLSRSRDALTAAEQGLLDLRT